MKTHKPTARKNDEDAHLALKSQSQSRATIQAVVELKYPRQVVVTIKILSKHRLGKENYYLNDGLFELLFNVGR